MDESQVSLTEGSSTEVEAIDVDAELMKADPTFEDSLRDFQSDLANIEIQPDDEIANLEEKQSLVRKSIVVVKDRIRQGFLFIKYFVIWLLTDGIMKIINGVKGLVLGLRQGVGEAWQTFGLMSGKKKLMFFLFLGLGGGISVGFYFVIKKQILDRQVNPFIGSMTEVANHTFIYDAEAEVEPLFDSTRVRIYAFQLKPMVVNLRRLNPGANPMGVFEFVCEGNSKDVLVEIKLRESEIRDRVQRVVEGFDYETLDTKDGKLMLRESIKKELNSLLLKGELLRIQIKSIIIKP